MQETASDVVVGVLVAVFGLIGLILAIGARDVEILIFGFSLAAFAVAFDVSLLRGRGKGGSHG